jgi:hypothetical protein
MEAKKNKKVTKNRYLHKLYALLRSKNKNKTKNKSQKNQHTYTNAWTVRLIFQNKKLKKVFLYIQNKNTLYGHGCDKTGIMIIFGDNNIVSCSTYQVEKRTGISSLDVIV